MTMLSMLFIGFLLGVKHALESDHLAAVATLATHQQSLRSTVHQGIAWGVGHTVTLVLVGGVVLVLGTAIPAYLEQSLELCVGVMLVALGTDVVRRVLRSGVHFHVHRHRGEVHVHAHRHDAVPSRSTARLPHIGAHASGLPALQLGHAWEAHDHEHVPAVPLRALAIGIMHGLAGSAALVVLSLQSVASWPIGLGYIVLFGVGSIVGMGLLSVTIAVPLRLSGRYLSQAHRGLTTCVGILTVGLGAWIVYDIGFAEGLFRG